MTLPDKSTTDDSGFLRRLRAADPEACETVVRLHWESVYRQQWLQCFDRELAADLTQETFVEAWKSVRGFRGESHIRTWLHTLAVRVWQRHLAKRPREQASPLTLQTLADPQPGPETVAEQGVTRERVRAALQRLPEAQRESIVLFYQQEMKYEEIAAAVGIPVGTVKSRLHEGLKRLRQLLGTENHG